jgi:16S rRNA (guanine527-N7)-methyltransferase
VGAVAPAPAAADTVFGDRVPLAHRYVTLLASSGVERGLIGPREVDRLWDRHVLNCAVIGSVVPPGSRVVDVGSGAGLPGIPLALACPGLELTLLEPMARRVDWLTEVLAELDLPVTVVRGRAEDRSVLTALGGADVVTARAVAPLARLVGWTLPLLRPGGLLVAMKGQTAAEEIARDRDVVHSLGGRAVRVHDCGQGIVDPLTRVVLVSRENRENSASDGRTGAVERPERNRPVRRRRRS